MRWQNPHSISHKGYFTFHVPYQCLFLKKPFVFPLARSSKILFRFFRKDFKNDFETRFPDFTSALDLLIRPFNISAWSTPWIPGIIRCSVYGPRAGLSNATRPGWCGVGTQFCGLRTQYTALRTQYTALETQCTARRTWSWRMWVFQTPCGRVDSLLLMVWAPLSSKKPPPNKGRGLFRFRITMLWT